MEDNFKTQVVADRVEDQGLMDVFAEFVGIVRRLRRDCPWDREQTHDSIKHLLIEETYETVEAIDEKDMDELKKELGDLFLHVVFHSTIAEDAGAFTLKQVLQTEAEKLVRRHPHVYGDTSVAGTADVLSNWEEIKMTEGRKKSVLDGVPGNLPALLKAHRIQEKVSGVGFDFPEKEEAWKKVEEELRELRELEPEGNMDRMEDEFGDVLFALVNYGRFLDITPEVALRRTNDKFTRRFKYIEARLAEIPRSLKEATLEEMDQLWEEAKMR